MSLLKTVVALIERNGPANADTLLPDCHGHTREQVIRALQNAATRRMLHCVGRCDRLNVYAAGPAAPATPRPRIVHTASVWHLGQVAAR